MSRGAQPSHPKPRWEEVPKDFSVTVLPLGDLWEASAFWGCLKFHGARIRTVRKNPAAALRSMANLLAREFSK